MVVIASPRIELELEVVKVVFAHVALASHDEQDAGSRQPFSQAARDNATPCAASHSDIIVDILVMGEALDSGYCDSLGVNGKWGLSSAHLSQRARLGLRLYGLSVNRQRVEFTSQSSGSIVMRPDEATLLRCEGGFHS